MASGLTAGNHHHPASGAGMGAMPVMGGIEGMPGKAGIAADVPGNCGS